MKFHVIFAHLHYTLHTHITHRCINMCINDLNEVRKTNVLFVLIIILDSLEEFQKIQVAPEQFLAFDGHKTELCPVASYFSRTHYNVASFIPTRCFSCSAV